MKRRAEKLRDQLPDVLTIMASSLRAGHSFMQSLDTVAKEIAQPAATEFQRVVSEIRLGRPTDDALEALAERVGSPDFRWAVLAVNIQREVGGNLAEILDNVADTLRERAHDAPADPGAHGRGPALGLGAALLPVGDRASTCSSRTPTTSACWSRPKLGIIMLVRRRRPAGGRGPLDEKDRGYRCLTSSSLSPSRPRSSPSCSSGSRWTSRSSEKNRAVRLLESQVSGGGRDARRPARAGDAAGASAHAS